MGNIRQFITFITLLNLGCVLSQQVTWVNSDGRDIVVTEGNNPVEIECFYRVPIGTDQFEYLPSLFKIQDLKYVEDTLDQPSAALREIDTGMGFLLALASSVKGDYGDGERVAAAFGTSSTDNQLQDGQRKLVVTIQRPIPSDSAKYVCHIEHNGEVYQQVHSLTVLPSNRNNLLEITLSGMADATDNNTRFEPNEDMNYYSNEDNANPVGVLECKVCDGASEPIIKIMIGDDDITAQIPIVEESDDVVLVGDDDGEERQMIQRCFTRRHSTYRLTPDHNGKEIVCSARINDADGEQYAFAETDRMITVYHKAKKVEGSCESPQFSPLNTGGQMTCAFSVNPAAQSVVWVKTGGNRYDTDDQTGFDWSATNIVSESYTTSILSFDEVTDDHYGEYYLEITNEAGRSEIYITFEEGQEIPWVRPSEEPGASERPSTGASAIHCALSLILASLLLTMKLMTS